MATNSNAELRLAQHLSAPFALPGRSTQPLSFRLLPEGAMVVISADGRKLWFTLEEVNTAREKLGMPTVEEPVKKKKKVEIVTLPNGRSSTPCGGSRDGMSEMIVLPPDLKHLEDLVNDQFHRH